MTRAFVAALSGFLFGLGLAVAQMTDPAKVINFLDITGNWDPSLLFVMGGALGASLLTFRWILKRPHPLNAATFDLPTRRTIDQRLIGGATLFGIGWGLSGYCPGPAISALGLMTSEALVVVLAIFAGFIAHARIFGRGT